MEEKTKTQLSVPVRGWFFVLVINRSKAGFKSTGVYHSVNNANKITIIGEAPSAEAINAFMANPELKAAMEKGGVTGMPDVKILNKI